MLRMEVRIGFRILSCELDLGRSRIFRWDGVSDLVCGCLLDIECVKP